MLRLNRRRGQAPCQPRLACLQLAACWLRVAGKQASKHPGRLQYRWHLDSEPCGGVPAARPSTWDSPLVDSGQMCDVESKGCDD